MEQVWKPFDQAGRPAEDWPEVRETLEQFAADRQRRVPRALPAADGARRRARVRARAREARQGLTQAELGAGFVPFPGATGITGLSQPGGTTMDFSEIVFAILLGLFAGAVGKLLMPGDDPGGVIATILLGIAGLVRRLPALHQSARNRRRERVRLGRRDRRDRRRHAAARDLPGRREQPRRHPPAHLVQFACAPPVRLGRVPTGGALAYRLNVRARGRPDKYRPVSCGATRPRAG